MSCSLVIPFLHHKYRLVNHKL